MKKIMFLIIGLVLLIPDVKSQSMKLKNWAFRYEYLPERPLALDYKTYKVESLSDATDGVSQDHKFVNIGEEYIMGYKNISVVYVKSGMMVGGAVIGGKEEGTKPETTPDIMVSVIFKNIEMLDKKDFLFRTTNLQTNLEESFYTYKLTFKFPYKIRVKEVRTGKIILDTLIDVAKTAIFPNDYRFDAFGNKMTNSGAVSKPALDMEYSKNENSLYGSSKKVLAKNCMNESKVVLKSLYGFDPESTKIMLYYVKSKDKMFDVCDTAEDLLRSIVDTTTSNTKKGLHLNWHCKSVKSDAAKLTALYERMLNDSKYISVFETAGDKSEFTYKIKRNLILAYLFNDEFEKADQLHSEISGVSINDISDQTMVILGNLIKREIRLYNKHKSIFAFN